MSINEYGIVANVISDKVLRIGAKVYLLNKHGDATNYVVQGVSKGGRIVVKFIAAKRLTNFRAAWFPEHIRSKLQCCWNYSTKEEAQKDAEAITKLWGDVQFYDKTGKIKLQEGVTENEAFKRQADILNPRTDSLALGA